LKILEHSDARKLKYIITTVSNESKKDTNQKDLKTQQPKLEMISIIVNIRVSAPWCYKSHVKAIEGRYLSIKLE